MFDFFFGFRKETTKTKTVFGVYLCVLVPNPQNLKKILTQKEKLFRTNKHSSKRRKKKLKKLCKIRWKFLSEKFLVDYIIIWRRKYHCFESKVFKFFKVFFIHILLCKNIFHLKNSIARFFHFVVPVQKQRRKKSSVGFFVCYLSGGFYYFCFFGVLLYRLQCELCISSYEFSSKIRIE